VCSSVYGHLSLTKRNHLHMQGECAICMVEAPWCDLLVLSCGHVYCNGCLAKHLQTQVSSHGVCAIACPALGCSILIDEPTILRLITDLRVLRLYQQLVADDFVAKTRLLKWCPAPDCIFAVKVSRSYATNVVCACSHRFCFGWYGSCRGRFSLWCTTLLVIYPFRSGQEPHMPLPCELVAKFLKNALYEMEADDANKTANAIGNAKTAQWIREKTKKCPQCSTTIEKNGGCKHMRCGVNSCKHDFCWTCMGPWGSHKLPFLNCPSINERGTNTQGPTQENSGAEAEHCTARLGESGRGGILDAIVARTADHLQCKAGMSWIDVQFLPAALETLLRYETR
jgi:ariadne-1